MPRLLVFALLLLSSTTSFAQPGPNHPDLCQEAWTRLSSTVPFLVRNEQWRWLASSWSGRTFTITKGHTPH
jgi:hypothetical protein